MSIKIRIFAFDSGLARLALFGVCLAISIGLPSFIHIQWITGPLINSILMLAAVLIGPMEAIFLGMMPSTVALASGLLPLPLAPMVPFIMLGNALMIFIFYHLHKKHFIGAVVLAAFLKFAFLHFTVALLMSRLLEGKIVAQLALMMSWPQFFTALIGGAIAYSFLKGLKKI